MTVRKIPYALILSALLLVAQIFPQTTAFNFQGRLNDGAAPATGQYDLQFKLFDSLSGGLQVGATINRPGLGLVNGVFSATLDFGAGAFGSGNRFLEIGVRPFGSSNAHVILGARQQIMAVPIAVNSLALNGVPSTSFARLGVSNAGTLDLQGSATQSPTASGLPKAMLAVTATGAIARCFNGVNGNSTGDCGISIGTNVPNTGVYTITFPFTIDNRFWLASNNELSGVSEPLTTTISPLSGVTLRVSTFRNGEPAPLPFHLFIF